MNLISLFKIKSKQDLFLLKSIRVTTHWRPYLTSIDTSLSNCTALCIPDMFGPHKTTIHHSFKYADEPAWIKSKLFTTRVACARGDCLIGRSNDDVIIWRWALHFPSNWMYSVCLWIAGPSKPIIDSTIIICYETQHNKKYNFVLVVMVI